jgi:hypothetical protein
MADPSPSRSNWVPHRRIKPHLPELVAAMVWGRLSPLMSCGAPIPLLLEQHRQYISWRKAAERARASIYDRTSALTEYAIHL